MGKTKCPRCGFNYTVFNMNTKPWRCKCGAMLKGNVGWRKLLIIAGVLLLVQITASMLLGLRIPTGAMIGVLVVMATQSIGVEEAQSGASGKPST